jgi:hypothetical protein
VKEAAHPFSSVPEPRRDYLADGLGLQPRFSDLEVTAGILVEKLIRRRNQNRALMRSYVVSSASGNTLVSPTTVMKLESATHRGSTCMWM